MYFIMAAGDDDKGLLAKNFMSYLCSKTFLGSKAEDSVDELGSLVFIKNSFFERIESVSILNSDPDQMTDNIDLIKTAAERKIILLADLTSDHYVNDLNKIVSCLTDLKKQDETCSIFIVGSKTDYLSPDQLEHAREVLNSHVTSFSIKGIIDCASTVSAKTGEGFQQLENRFLIENLLCKIQLFRVAQGSKKIDGLDEIIQIQNNKALSPEKRFSKIVKVAHWKKSDYSFTKFFHSKIRNRDPNVEELYQFLGNLSYDSSKPLGKQNILSIAKAIDDMEKWLDYGKPAHIVGSS